MRRRVSLRYFFKQTIDSGCAVCAANVLFKKYGLQGAIFPFSKKKGTSSWKLIRELRKMGLEARSKTISIRSLKEWSILWYPPKGRGKGDHYVVVGKIRNNRFLIYDSEREEPYWEGAENLKKNWYRWYRNSWCGWIIEVSKSNGSA